jgi:hypothetical protein
MSKSKNINKRKKIHKGGAILGKGRDGCVVDPPLMCSADVSSLNKVSKLIDVSQISQAEYNQFVEEFKIGQLFKKIDPKNQHFLPGIEICSVEENDIKNNKQLMKDVADCGYKKQGRNTVMLNIVMKKGQDFLKITNKLNNRNDVLKSMAYLLHGANHCVYNLNACLFDIKYPNLLYSSDDTDPSSIYPVFIDFSKDFVIHSQDEFYFFIDHFCSFTGYWVWPIELNALFYKRYTMNMSKEEISKSNTINKFKKDLKKDHNIDLNDKNDMMFFQSIADYMWKNSLTEHDLRGLYNKIMVYQIGVAYFDALKNTPLYNDPLINNIISQMLFISHFDRPYFSDLFDIFNQHISYRRYSDLYIKIHDKSIKNKIKNMLKVKNAFQSTNKVKSQALNFSTLYKSHKSKTPISIRKSIKNKSKKSIKNKNAKKVSKKKDLKKDCMKMTLKEIKATKEYKSLPRSIGKSKLSKKDLCKVFNTESIDYSKLSKDQLINIIKNKKNCTK